MKNIYTFLFHFMNCDWLIVIVPMHAPHVGLGLITDDQISIIFYGQEHVYYFQ